MSSGIVLGSHIDIWYLDATMLLALRNWKNFLSSEEKERARKFHFRQDQETFALYHACKRLILSGYLKIRPHELNIMLDGNGKPFLHNYPLFFNLSHTKNMAAFAVAQSIDIGIDIEYMKNSDNLVSIAQRFFHPNEVQQLMDYSESEKQKQYFYQLWTAKEALLKASGEGIIAGLNTFYVDPSGSRNAIIPQTYSSSITLIELSYPENYSACLAILGENTPIRYCDMNILLEDY